MVLKQGFLMKTHLALLLYVYFAPMCLDLASDSDVAKVNDRWRGKITAWNLDAETLAPFWGRCCLHIDQSSTPTSQQPINEAIEINCTFICQLQQLK